MSVTRKKRAAMSVEARENQMIALAVDLAEKQLMEGTASAQVITHYLKLGSTRNMLEREMMVEQKKLLKAKTESIESSAEVKTLVEDALRAMREYSGHGDDQ